MPNNILPSPFADFDDLMLNGLNRCRQGIGPDEARSRGELDQAVTQRDLIL